MRATEAQRFKSEKPTNDRAWKAVSRFKAATDMILEMTSEWIGLVKEDERSTAGRR